MKQGPTAISTTKKQSIKSPTLRLYPEASDPTGFTAKSRTILSVTNSSTAHKHPNGSMIITRPGYLGAGSSSPTPFTN